jgi:tetratricopeptide (TPR) repeat protein
VALRRTLEGHPQYGALAEAIDALGLAKSGKLEDALRAAEQLSRIPAMQAESLLIAGEVFQTQGNWSQALGAFHRALELHPNNVRAHRWLGALYYDLGAMQLATVHLGKVAELDPTDYRALRLCGLIRYDYEQFAESADDYRRALERSPPGPVADEIRLGLAAALRQQHRVDEAFAALESCPESVAVLTERAMCFEAAGQVDKALDLARRAVDQAPHDAQANLILGRLHLSLHHAADAVGPLRIALAGDPTDHKRHYLLGRALLQAGETEEGQAELERSAPLRDMFLRLADLHLKANANPYDVGVRVQLGELAEKLGRLQNARTWYRAALGLDPENRQATEAIARLESLTKP